MMDNIFKNGKDFYPTPKSFVIKMLDGINFDKVSTVLEPSAGDGNIVEVIKEKQKNTYRSKEWIEIDCVEKDPDLRSVLKCKGFRVIHDDFLTFNTYKRYDLIVMNPPFSEGAKHLLKALAVQRYGGNIICILNADTIRNLCTNERKMLYQNLKALDASIEFEQGVFDSAERRSDVEIAVIKVSVPESKGSSIIYDSLKSHFYRENGDVECTELTDNDPIKAAVRAYNKEVELGISLIREYRALKPYLNEDIGENCLSLSLGKDVALTENNYVKDVRTRYWTKLFNDVRFTGNMTSKQRNDYRSKVSELSDYDFSPYNILSIKEQICGGLISGIEECIIKLFDELSYQYSYSDELSKNIHYYNGWKTNKSWIINEKVVMPFMNAWDDIWKKYAPFTGNYRHNLKDKLTDIEKALNYLDGGLTDGSDIEDVLKTAEESQQMKDIECKYFTLTFYKKGTCHLKFKNLELLKKLNIFGSQQKGWLPPSYGKKTYQEMEESERAVVDEFEGKDAYAKTLFKASYYIYSPKNELKRISASA